MAYNPYKTVKTISELKGKWHNAKEKGEDPSQYQQEAIQYYNELRDNGHGKLADDLTLADYIGSRDILAGLTEPKPYDDWYDSITSKKIEEASNPAVSETADRIFSAYENANNLLNGEVTKDANGNVVSGLNVDYYNTGKNQLGYINDYDITSQDWYDDLMAGYQLGGQKAANGALSSGAAGNSGNIDSYAAANANRQQLAFTNAGNEAARALAAQNMAAWQQLYDSMGGHLGTMGQQANDALNIGAQVYATDSAERQNALNQAAALEAQRMQNYINEFMANIEADTTKYGADKTLEGTKYGADIDLQGSKYKADQALQEAYADAQAKRDVADKEAESALELAKAEWANAQNAALDEELSLDDAFNELVNQFKLGNLTFQTWDELEEMLIQNGYDASKVQNKIEPYATRYANPQNFAGR